MNKLKSYEEIFAKINIFIVKILKYYLNIFT